MNAGREQAGVADRRLLPTALFGVAALAAFGAAVAGGGTPDKGTWFALCVLLGCTLGFAFARLDAPRAGALTALLFAGGAAQLLVTDPGWYQFIHLSPDGIAEACLFALIAAQGVLSLLAVVMVAGRDRLQKVIGAFGLFRLVSLFVLSGLFTVSIMGFMWRGDYLGYLLHLVAGGIFAGIGLLNVLAIVTSPDLPQIAPGPRLAERLSHAVPVVAPLVLFMAAVALSWLAFEGIPIVEDETAYLFQAHTFAGGAVMAPPLPAGTAPAFEYYLLRPDGRGWYAVTAPGWPAVLAIGVLFGAPTLINPLLGGLSVWLGHGFWKRVGGRGQADLAALLMAASPWLLGMSASLMTHPLCLALTLGAWLLLAIARDRADAGATGVAALAFAAGLCMGWLFLTRALEGVLLGGLSGIWLLWRFGQRRRYGPVFGYALGCIATGALLFPYNMVFTGHPLATPQTVYLAALWGAGANAFGFAKDIGPPGGWGTLDLWHGHSFAEGLINLTNGLNSLNFELFGWTCGSLLLIWCYLLWARPQRPDRLMLIVAASVVGLHFFYWFTATFYIGPRYWFGAFFAFVILSVAGASGVIDRLQGAGFAAARHRIVTAIVICCLFGGIVTTSWRGGERYSTRAGLGRLIAAYQMPEAPEIGPEGAIVLLPCQELVEAAMYRNDPYLRPGRTIYALDSGAAGNEALLGAFPDRTPVVATTLRRECSE